MNRRIYCCTNTCWSLARMGQSLCLWPLTAIRCLRNMATRVLSLLKSRQESVIKDSVLEQDIPSFFSFRLISNSFYKDRILFHLFFCLCESNAARWQPKKEVCLPSVMRTHPSPRQPYGTSTPAKTLTNHSLHRPQNQSRRRPLHLKSPSTTQEISSKMPT